MAMHTNLMTLRTRKIGSRVVISDSMNTTDGSRKKTTFSYELGSGRLSGFPQRERVRPAQADEKKMFLGALGWRRVELVDRLGDDSKKYSPSVRVREERLRFAIEKL